MQENTSSTLFIKEAERTLYAEVIIPLYLPINYTWAIPNHFTEKISVGSRVEVQLKNKKYSGIIKTIAHMKNLKLLHQKIF